MEQFDFAQSADESANPTLWSAMDVAFPNNSFGQIHGVGKRGRLVDVAYDSGVSLLSDTEHGPALETNPNLSDEGIDVTNMTFCGTQVPLTMTFWGYLYDNTDLSGRICHRSVFSVGGWRVHITTGHVLILMARGNGNSYIRSQADTAMPAGEWFHYAITWDGSINYTNTAHYLNGVLLGFDGASTDATGVIRATSDNNFFLMCDAASGSTSMNGQMLDFQLYGRELEPAEIQWLCDAGPHGLTRRQTKTVGFVAAAPAGTLPPLLEADMFQGGLQGLGGGI